MGGLQHIRILEEKSATHTCQRVTVSSGERLGLLQHIRILEEKSATHTCRRVMVSTGERLG